MTDEPDKAGKTKKPEPRRPGGKTKRGPTNKRIRREEIGEEIEERKRETTDDLTKEYAYHEAGHVGMALVMRKKFSYVTIEPGKDSRGFVMMSADRTGTHRQLFVAAKGGAYRERTSEELRDEGDNIERRILVLVAGYVSSRILYHGDAARDDDAQRERFQRHSEGASDDYQTAYRFAEVLIEPCHRRRFSAGYNEPEMIVYALESHAYVVLKHPQVWAGVQRLAELLLQKPRIGYKEARSVFIAAYWAAEDPAAKKSAKKKGAAK